MANIASALSQPNSRSDGEAPTKTPSPQGRTPAQSMSPQAAGPFLNGGPLQPRLSSGFFVRRLLEPQPVEKWDGGHKSKPLRSYGLQANCVGVLKPLANPQENRAGQNTGKIAGGITASMTAPGSRTRSR